MRQLQGVECISSLWSGFCVTITGGGGVYSWGRVVQAARVLVIFLE